MCLAVLTSLIFRRKWYTITLVSWSIIIGFSRIYLARHFFTDVLCGLILGAIIAYLIYKLWEKVWNIYLKKHNQQCSVS
jgi:undecaprenyl-diphosphatase